MLLTLVFQCWQAYISSLSLGNHFHWSGRGWKGFLQLETAVK